MDLSDIHPVDTRNLDSEWKPGIAEAGLLRGVPNSWYGTYRCVDPSGEFQFVRFVRGYEVLFGKWDVLARQIRWIQHGFAKFTGAASGTGAFDIHLIEAPFESSTSIDYCQGGFKAVNQGDDAIRIELTGERQSFGCFTGVNPPKIPLHLILMKIVVK